MNIVIVGRSYFPFVDDIDAMRLKSLALALKNKVENVVVVAPTFDKIVNSEIPVARRLSKTIGSAGGTDVSFIRYDSNTPDGLDVHFLGASDESETPQHFTSAVWNLLGELDAPVDAVISWNGVYDMASGAPDSVPVLGVLDTAQSSRDTIANFERLVIHDGVSVEDVAARVTPVHIGPFSLEETNDLHKPSSKTQLQMTLGFPVSPTIPMFYIDSSAGDVEDADLKQMLKQDLQIVVHGDSDGIDRALVDAFSDRLCIVPVTTPVAALLAAADFVYCGTNKDSAVRTMMHRAVPIVVNQLGVVFAELSGTLDSGCALLVGSQRNPTLVSAVATAVGAYAQNDAMFRLSECLPTYVLGVEQVIDTYLAQLA